MINRCLNKVFDACMPKSWKRKSRSKSRVMHKEIACTSMYNLIAQVIYQ